MTDKELLAICDALKLEAEFHLGSASEASGLAKRVWTVATELKRRLTEPSEREKALAEVKAVVRGYIYGDTSNTATCILRDVEALTAYEEKEETK